MARLVSGIITCVRRSEGRVVLQTSSGESVEGCDEVAAADALAEWILRGCVVRRRCGGGGTMDDVIAGLGSLSMM